MQCSGFVKLAPCGFSKVLFINSATTQFRLYFLFSCFTCFINFNPYFLFSSYQPRVCTFSKVISIFRKVRLVARKAGSGLRFLCCFHCFVPCCFINFSHQFLFSSHQLRLCVFSNVVFTNGAEKKAGSDFRSCCFRCFLLQCFINLNSQPLFSSYQAQLCIFGKVVFTHGTESWLWFVLLRCFLCFIYLNFYFLLSSYQPQLCIFSKPVFTNGAESWFSFALLIILFVLFLVFAFNQ